jgi:AmiR/NasT family two-component response regulator
VDPTPPLKKPRVMLGNLGPIALMGMRRLLSEDGIEVVGEQEQSAGMAPEVERLRPDIVVLDLDRTDSQQLSERVRLACPHTKVVLWANTENVMEVMDPGASRPRWVLSGVPEDLLTELSTVQVTQAEE